MRSLSNHLTVGLVLVFIGLLAAACGLSFATAREALYQHLDATIWEKASMLIRFIEQRDLTLRVHSQHLHIRYGILEFTGDEGTGVFEVWDWNSRSVQRSPSLGDFALELRHGGLDRPAFWNLDLPDGRELRAVGIHFKPRLDSLHDHSIPQRDAYLVLASDRTEIDAAVERQGLVTIVTSITLLLAVTLVVPWVVRRGFRPIHTVTRQAELIDAHTLGERIHTEGTPRELIPICDCLNRLLFRLEKSFERERRFSADVAHELLTPLAELRSLHEFALRYPEESQRTVMEQVLRILLDLEATVTCLIELGRTELQQPTPPPRIAVAVGQLARALTRALETKARERQLGFLIRVADEARITAEPSALRSILSNLLANATAYADPGTVVEVNWRRSEAAFTLEVVNRAVSLTPDDLPRMFERFWRKDESRTGSGHSGLGLPLARELARTQGYALEAFLSSEGALTMSLRGSIARLH